MRRPRPGLTGLLKLLVAKSRLLHLVLLTVVLLVLLLVLLTRLFLVMVVALCCRSCS